MFLLCFFGPVLYKWPLNWRWQIIAMCAHGSTRAQEEKNMAPLGVFIIWTLNGQHWFAMCFPEWVKAHSDSMQFHIPSTISAAHKGFQQWHSLRRCFARWQIVLLCFLELYIFTEGALQSLQGVIFQEFCHRTSKQRLVWIQHGFCQIFMGSYSKDERNVDSFTLAVLVLVYSSFLQMQLNLKQFPFSCRVYYTHSSNWTHKDTVSD